MMKLTIGRNGSDKMPFIDFANQHFGELKKKDPVKAHDISTKPSGDPFGLHPDVDAYRATKTVYAEFDEDGNLITDIDIL